MQEKKVIPAATSSFHFTTLMTFTFKNAELPTITVIVNEVRCFIGSLTQS